MNYYLYKTFYFSEIPANLSLELEDLLEKEGGSCFGFVPFTIISENEMAHEIPHESFINEYFITSGISVGETILIKF